MSITCAAVSDDSRSEISSRSADSVASRCLHCAHRYLLVLLSDGEEGDEDDSDAAAGRAMAGIPERCGYGCCCDEASGVTTGVAAGDDDDDDESMPNTELAELEEPSASASAEASAEAPEAGFAAEARTLCMRRFDDEVTPTRAPEPAPPPG